MEVKIRYAGEGSVPLSQAYRDPNSAMLVGKSIANAAEEVGDAAMQYLDKKMRRDAATISMDVFSRVQADAQQGFLNAQSKSRSTLNADDPDAKLSDVDVNVNDPESKYDGKSFVDYSMGTLDDRMDQELRRVTNPYAREELRQRFSSLRADYFGKVLDYHSRTITESRLVAADSALNRMSQVTMDQPDQFSANLQQLQSYADNSGLDPVNKMKFMKSIAPVLADAAAMGTARLDPLLAEAQARDPATPWRQHLSAKELESVTNRIDQQKNQQAAKIYTEVLQSADSAEQSILNTGRGVPDYEAKLARLNQFSPEKAAPIIERINLAKESHNLKVQLDGVPVSQIDTFMEKLRPAGGAADYATQNKKFEYVQAIADKQKKLVKEDPAALVDFLYPESMAALPDNDLGAKMQFRDNVLHSKGVDEPQSRLITNSEADGLIASIKQSNPNAVMTYLRSLAAQADASGTNYSYKLFHDLGARENGLDPMYQEVFAKMQDPDTSVGVTNDLLGAIRVKKDLDKLLVGDSKKSSDFDTEVYKQMSGWTESYLKGSSSSRMSSASAMRESVSTLAKYYYQSSGDIKGSVKQAYQSLVGDTVYDTSTMLQIPKSVVDRGVKVQISDVAVKRDLEVTRKQVIQGSIKAVDVGQTFGPVLSSAEYKNLREDALKRSQWKTNEDYSGAYLMIQRSGAYVPVVKQDGTPFVVKFADVMRGGIYQAPDKSIRWTD